MVQRLNDANTALAQAVTIPQFKLVLDVAAAQEVFATRQRLGDEIIGHAHALKIEALAGLGELIKQAPKTKGTDRGGRPKIDGSRQVPSISPPTLAEQGVDKKTANLARKLAALSDTERNAVAAGDQTLAAVSRERTAKVREQRLSLPDAKFRVVYADPPWKYNDRADAGAVQTGGAERQYPVMSIAELCALDVKGICDQDAVLFLWVTSPLLFECQPVGSTSVLAISPKRPAGATSTQGSRTPPEAVGPSARHRSCPAGERRSERVCARFVGSSVQVERSRRAACAYNVAISRARSSWLSVLAPRSATTTSPPCSARAAWARSGRPPTPSSTARSR